MKRSVSAICMLLLSATLALAQGSSGGSGGSSGSGGTSSGSPSGSSSTPGASPGTLGDPTRRSGSPGTVTPGVVAPAPSDGATVGRAPGENPSNSSDLTNRSNPQDLNRPGGNNPQDLSTGTGAPTIMVPERR
jgi:hypothetical protein